MSTREAGTSGGVFASIRATPLPVRYLLVGVLVNQLGAFAQTFLVLYLTVNGFSIGQAGIALTCYSAGAVLGTLLGGELTHRLGPRGTIVAAMSVSAVVLAVLPFLAEPSMFALMLVAIALAGLATQCYRPAAAVLLSELMPAEHRVMAFSMMRIALNGGAALAPLIAAGLILVDWNLLFWFDATTALAYVLVARFTLPATSAPRDEEEAESGEQRRSAYAVMLRDGRYLAFLASVLLGTLIYVQYVVALPLKITSEGHPAALYSVVLATASVILVLTELKITSYVKNWVPWVAGAVGTAVMGVGVAGYGLGSHAVVIVIATGVFVLGVMISGPTMFAHPAKYPAEVRGRYVGTHQATFGLGSALGPTLGVFAWEAFGNGVWALCGVLGLIGAYFAMVGMRERTSA
ncbi:MFS transporter [Saccharothrix obliqua]|uniref:MFS transporter n=1 Tax=Saccharothrix obliqua TaxID=2861747 RepID=UPI001C5FB4C2|nr:MFS transporter [Saccharothrix obliqua]MBW4718029.1 MFS transporter [Saccharothrix obliqua]